MGYTPEQIEKSIKLAEEVARKENRLKLFQKHDLPESVISDVRTKSGGHLAELMNDPLAEKLLPQARIVVSMREARKVFLERQTKLGILLDAISNQTQVEEEGRGRSDKDSKDFFSEMPEEHGDWLKFLSALSSGNKADLLNALMGLLIGITINLTKQDLPPVAPEYDIPE